MLLTEYDREHEKQAWINYGREEGRKIAYKRIKRKLKRNLKRYLTEERPGLGEEEAEKLANRMLNGEGLKKNGRGTGDAKE